MSQSSFKQAVAAGIPEVLPEMPPELVEQLAASLARALVAAIRRDTVATSETGTTSACGTVGVDSEGTTTQEANP